MKKFLIYMLVLAGLLGAGFGSYYLVQDKENFYVLETTLYVTAGGEAFDIPYVWENKKKSSTLDVLTTNPEALSYNKETKKFVPGTVGGHVYVTFRTSNPKFRNVAVQVFVGDGSSMTPFYVSNAEMLSKIGTENFGLDKSYELTKDIDLSDGINKTGYFTPIGLNSATGFGGRFDGKGYTISNATLNPTKYVSGLGNTNAGLFEKVGPTGIVSNLKIDNIKVEGANLNNVGTISAINQGLIERVEIKSAIFDIANAQNLGGAVGLMQSTQKTTYGDTKTHSRTIAMLDRVSANVLIGKRSVLGEDGVEKVEALGTGGTIGGLVGKNTAGIVVYSYSQGEVHLNLDTKVYGGLVGVNEYMKFDTVGSYKNLVMGAPVKETYSAINLYVANAFENDALNEELIVGGIIGLNNDIVAREDGDNAEDSITNIIVGNYYDLKLINAFEQNQNSALVKSDLNRLFTKGVGKVLRKNTIEGENVDWKYDNVIDKTIGDTYYIAVGLNSEILKSKTNFVTREQTERIVENGQLDYKKSIIMWKFGEIWDINGNYPTLTYQEMKMSYEIYTGLEEEISTLTDFLNISLDGNYILIDDIDLSESAYNKLGIEYTPWTPIGSKNNPFMGGLQSATKIDENGNKSYFTIYNLFADGAHESQEAYGKEYGGLFGLTSQSANEIKNLKLQNFEVKNYQNAGALIGSNGYEYYVKLENGQNQRKNTTGISVENVSLINSQISGTKNVGGLIGINYGTINGVLLVDEYNEDVSMGSSTIELKAELTNANLGGIVGLNYGTIYRSFVKNGTNVKVTESENLNINAGGLVGYNNGTIDESGAMANRVSVPAKVSGGFGGITGTNAGTITRNIVKMKVNADSETDIAYVGGVSGIQVGAGKISDTLVTTGTELDGYSVGGIVGELNYSVSGKQINFTFDKNTGNLVIDNNNVFAISQSGVDGAVLNGHMVGGIASVITNGIVSNVYINASIGGLKDNSVKASFVADLPFIKSGNSISAGVIQNTYASVTFTGNGKAYAITKSEFLKEPIIDSVPLVEMKFNRPAGFIVNYLFDDDIDGSAEHPSTSNWFKDAWAWLGDQSWSNWLIKRQEGARSTTAELKGQDKYVKYGFSRDIWTFSDTGFAKLKSLDNLEKQIVSRTVRIDLNEDYILDARTQVKNSKNNKFATASINNGSSFEFRFVSNNEELYELREVVVKQNGNVIEKQSNGYYKIDKIYSDINITVEYKLYYIFKIEINNPDLVLHVENVRIIVEDVENQPTVKVVKVPKNAKLQVYLTNQEGQRYKEAFATNGKTQIDGNNEGLITINPTKINQLQTTIIYAYEN